MQPLLHEEELDRVVDQSLGWSPKVALTRIVGPTRHPDPATAAFFERGSPRFYQLGRRGVRRPIFIGLTRGRSVADCVTEHLTGTIDGRSTALARRLTLALRRAGDPADVWVIQAPVTATAVDPTDPLSVHATLLLLQSCLGAEIVNPGSASALPHSARAAGQEAVDGEAMAFGGIKRRLRQLAAAGGILLGLSGQPGDAGKSQRAVTELIETVVTSGQRKRDELKEKTKGAQDPVNVRDRPRRRRRRRRVTR